LAALAAAAMLCRQTQTVMPQRRFPPPWSVDDEMDACFIVRDGNL
jgi:hypothetical protein